MLYTALYLFTNFIFRVADEAEIALFAALAEGLYADEVGVAKPKPSWPWLHDGRRSCR